MTGPDPTDPTDPTDPSGPSGPSEPAEPPAPRGPRQARPREFAVLAFLMGAMVALGVGMAEASPRDGVIALAACVPLALAVHLLCTLAFRER